MAQIDINGLTCPHEGCGHINKTTAEFCAQCGQPLAANAAMTGKVPPLPPNATPDEKEEHWYRYVYQGDKVKQLTLRAVLMGGILGSILSISNLYTTLQLGWAFGVAITACVLSFVIWNTIRALTGGHLSQMTILENNCMQSTASAAGYSTGSTIGTAFGALLLLTGEHVSWKVLLPFTFFTAMLGVFLAIPLKRQMINIEQLPFPTGIAAAETLRSLYSHGKEALQKAYSLIAALFFGALIGLFRAFGMIPWLDKWFFNKLFGGLHLPHLVPFERWTATTDRPHRLMFGFDPSALLIAAGMIVGLRVSLSMLFGTLLLYCYVGPKMYQMDQANNTVEDYVINIPLVGGGTILHFPRWALWGGTSIMVFSSLASIALQWRTIARSFGSFGGGAGGKSSRITEAEVPTSWLVGGLIPIGIGMVIVQYLAFHINILLGIVAVLMSFVVSLVCCRATGETDTTPIGAMGKVTQLLYAILAPRNMTINLMTASVTANAGSSSADLLTDLKSGYLLGANARKQFIAQFCGVFFGTAAIVPAWYLMVPNKEVLEQKFALPSTQMWKATAEVLTRGISSLPETAVVAIIIGAFVGVLLPVLGALFPSASRYLPSAMGLGLSWVMPFANAFAFAIGAVLAWLWSIVHKRSEGTFRIPVASGVIAGESLMSAMLAIAATITGWFTKPPI